MSRQPLISVILAVYNGQTHIEAAVTSVLTQTYRHFELIIINDGSSDGTTAILAGLTDPRIRVIHNKTNRGLIASLNRGIDEARGEIIARMDGDDRSHPDRFAKQVQFLLDHPSYGLVGTLDAVINPDQTVRCIEPFLITDTDIRTGLAFKNQFCHGSIMLRRSALGDMRYDPKAKYFEDYDLWSRLALQTKLYNLPEVLYYYLDNPNGISATKADAMAQGSRLVRQRLDQKTLPVASVVSYFKHRRPYRLRTRTVDNHQYSTHLMREYQFLLYNVAKRTFSQGRPFKGFSIAALSFGLHPQTYLRKLWAR